ncbi:hypothetical protein [Dehalococcoides mccartyi]|uniref:hypothetical protein n=1 Tax=Dehalococcoides mccartyi TaxID=61435 RepID=UPI00059E0E06|nr:hypothetical protein [Dehalococcoides mccartyi]
MRSNKNAPEEPRHGKLGVNNLHKDQDPAQRGISILARMIAEAYMEELDQKRFAEMGVKPLYIEKIKIAMDFVNINNPKARQKLHILIDKAIETAKFEGLTENSPPLVLKNDGVSIWLKI